MPDVLYGTVSGSGIAEGMWLLDEETYNAVRACPRYNRFLFETSLEKLSRFGMPTFASKEDALAWIRENRGEWLEIGAAAIQAFKETGYCSWYEWSVDKWGTKWDAYQEEACRGREYLTYRFDTAWSPPFPVADRLATLYRDARFVHSYFDEGHGFWGISTYGNGHCIECRDSLKEDMVRLCLELRGYDPEHEEEEEETMD